MNRLREFLKTSYTCYQTVENAANLLRDAGFCALAEQDGWKLKEGGKYFVVRGGSIIAFRFAKKGAYKIVASHTDSPCLKLKENAALADERFTRLNTEPYGGGLWYTFFDRPLKIAGRAVYEEDGALTVKNFVSGYCVVLPSVAIHQNREANEKFAPNLQTELPLLSLGKTEWKKLTGGALSYDLFAVPADEPFTGGANGEFLSSPRLDNLTSVYTSLMALIGAENNAETQIAACFEAEEIGSHTRGGAGSDFLKSVLGRIAASQGRTDEELLRAYSESLLVSLDNAHSLHPNHPEKCDPTNKAVLGGGVVLKGHAGGAYTTDAVTAAIVKKMFETAGVKYQAFYNRSDMRSGGTLGAISLGQAGIPSVDLGLAQLAMHSAVETLATADLDELEKALRAVYKSRISVHGERIEIQ